jgi:ribosomal protein S18 acetylase RimI-like enzyme
MHAGSNPISVAQAPRVRMALESDAQAVARLINAAFIVEKVAFDGDRVDLVGVSVLMNKGTFLVAEAEDSGELAGCVYLEPHGDRCYLGLLSVAPALQGKGLGRRLAAAAEEFARNAGCRSMDLRIISPRRDTLLPVYTRLGYLETGTKAFSADVPVKVPCHYVLMTKPLD